MGERGELVLMERAIKQRWLTDDLKPVAMRRIAEILETSQDARAISRAAALVVAMEAQNQKDEHVKLDDIKQRIIAIAARCGIDPSVLGISQASGFGAESGNSKLAGEQANGT
jgi:hypothetical protein